MVSKKSSEDIVEFQQDRTDYPSGLGFKHLATEVARLQKLSGLSEGAKAKKEFYQASNSLIDFTVGDWILKKPEPGTGAAGPFQVKRIFKNGTLFLDNWSGVRNRSANEMLTMEQSIKWRLGLKNLSNAALILKRFKEMHPSIDDVEMVWHFIKTKLPMHVAWFEKELENDPDRGPFRDPNHPM